MLLGVAGLGLYGAIATLQADPNFGRIFAAYGGVFILGSLAWGRIFEGFHPDRYDLLGAASAWSAWPCSCSAHAPFGDRRPRVGRRPRSLRGWRTVGRLRPQSAQLVAFDQQ